MSKLIEILENIRPDAMFLESKNFIQDGYLDSFDLTILIDTLEELTGCKIAIEAVTEENFQNIASILKVVETCGGDSDALK